MNNSKEFPDDFLKQYINSGKIEKAPEGFTERLKIRFQTEKIPAFEKKYFLRSFRVPVISGVITGLLIMSAILLPSTDNDSFVYTLLKPLNDFALTLPQINFGKISGFTFPELIIYISLAIFMLSLFDRVLNNLFRKERK
jgi:hypothetical protein